ncbi:MAG: hypothetical protein PHD13_04950 [Methanocellales archaeon]|nr:hypothetical protein [Methanocellales archaeon]MDD3291856.1 hypothetical protein [Methanocellales archaeon]MDD5235499.1 hypothetical protein [Methanocellales archaeon]MDD5485118.1 hypothetical protein [Methanocellales archaeon]
MKYNKDSRHSKEMKKNKSGLKCQRRIREKTKMPPQDGLKLICDFIGNLEGKEKLKQFGRFQTIERDQYGRK